MPEGDTIWRTAAALRPRLVGSRVRRSSHTGLEDREVLAVDAVGKHLLIRFEGGWVLHSHMGMTGSWHVYRPGERWRKPAWRARAMLECDEVVAVCFSAPRMERARSSPRTAIGEVLLDQRVCAGIGNVYRCEALWEHRVSPWLEVGAIDDERLRALFEWTREAMRGNLRGGIARRFGNGRAAAAHGRRGRPCPRCGTSIATRRQGDLARWTYYCPECQRV
jgi:endonuclease-8